VLAGAQILPQHANKVQAYDQLRREASATPHVDGVWGVLRVYGKAERANSITFVTERFAETLVQAKAQRALFAAGKRSKKCFQVSRTCG